MSKERFTTQATRVARQSVANVVRTAVRRFIEFSPGDCCSACHRSGPFRFLLLLRNDQHVPDPGVWFAATKLETCSGLGGQCTLGSPGCAWKPTGAHTHLHGGDFAVDAVMKAPVRLG